MTSIILRVFSKAGRSRIEINLSSTLHDLKTELSQRLQIDTRQLKLFKDEAMRQPVNERDTATIQSLKFKNGDILHVGNQDANLASVAAA